MKHRNVSSLTTLLLAVCFCLSEEGRGSAKQPPESDEGKLRTQGSQTETANKTVLESLEENFIQKNQEREKIETDTGVTDEDANEAEEDLEEPGYWKWFVDNKTKIINTLVGTFSIAVIVFIVYKMFKITKSIETQKEQIQNYAQQLDQIIEGGNKLVYATWRDQQEKIKFVENPAYKSKSPVDLSKAQRLQEEINKYEARVNQKRADISALRDKGSQYEKEIIQLEQDYERGRMTILDEGAALGFADTVLREFR